MAKGKKRASFRRRKPGFKSTMKAKPQRGGIRK